MRPKRPIDGDTLPDALAALARARARTLADLDGRLAERDTDNDEKRPQGPDDERVAFR